MYMGKHYTEGKLIAYSAIAKVAVSFRISGRTALAGLEVGAHLPREGVTITKCRESGEKAYKGGRIS